MKYMGYTVFKARKLRLVLAAAIACCYFSVVAAELNSPAASVPLEAWPAIPRAALDPATERLIDRLLEQMTLPEKIGQMIQADIAFITPAELTRYKLGSILAGGNAAPGNNVRTTPQAWLDLTDTLHRAALAAEVKGHAAIPILFGIDAVHGNAKLIGATIFPHNVGLGATHDAGLVRKIGEATAEEVAAVGIDWTFAPTVAVARDVRWGRSYESYSESPQLVAEYAPAMLEGLQGKRGTSEYLAPGHTLASVKHFLGDGGTRSGRDQGDTQISEAELSAVHGAGYPPAIKAGAMIVMASYNSWNGVKMHANHHLLTAVLKRRMGFQGFVVGDWNAQEQISGCTKSSCAAAYLAGIDMLMAPDSWRALYVNTLAQARSGQIPPQRINDAVRRILRVKVMSGIFERPPPKTRAPAGDFKLGGAAHRTLARAAVRESLVLLKNTHRVLPLKSHAQILVCGDLADDIGAQSGGWTIDWQGDHNRNVDFPGATSIFAGIRAAVASGGGSALLSGECEYREKPDAAVVVFGERPYAEFQGDRETLEFSPNDKQALALLKRLRAAGIPTVSVFLSGRPMWVNPEINASDAFAAAWWPGSEGEGVADVLFGTAHGEAIDFTGRLSFSWPNTAMPVRFGADGSVERAAYPRGFGLTYRDADSAPPLSEDPKIAATQRAPQGSLYHGSHAVAPWSVFLADGDAQVHLTTRHLASPHAAVSTDVTQEGNRILWSGTRAGEFQISGRVQDLRAAAARDLDIRFEYRLDALSAKAVSLVLHCAEPRCGTAHGAGLDLIPVLREAPLHQWRSATVSLSCFTQTGADLSAVEMPFVISATGPLDLTISEVRLVAAQGGEHRPCPHPT
ncbi:MAG: exo 1,3/1,4-beta-D-glucan glucohydrolase [Pseudomonadota bacterium]|nr:exo 1,3/1,4-beta-D-glucan glucohydrolase [Pseudomonadota bacterium]